MLLGTTISGQVGGATVTLEVASVVISVEESYADVYVSDAVGRITDLVFRNAYPVVAVIVEWPSMLRERATEG